jgi:hypothetical protein
MFTKVDFAGFFALIIAMIALVAVIAAPTESVAATRSASHHRLRVNGPMCGYAPDRESVPDTGYPWPNPDRVHIHKWGIVLVRRRSGCDELKSSRQVCARKREGKR